MLPGLRKIQFLKRATCFLLALGILSALEAPAFGDEEDLFKEYEIRVIRPKYFTKVKRFELGAQLTLVMNDTFVYTLLASGILTYHFSESLALEAALAIGQSIDRSEKDILINEFEIKTEVFRTLYTAELSILYTPIYGKVQLPEGRLVYFDTFLAFGAGMTGVEWKYDDYCQEKDDGDANTQKAEIRANTVKTYPSAVAGLGQRLFYSRSAALKWDLRWHSIFYDGADSACAEGTASGTKVYNNITLQLGASKFF